LACIVGGSRTTDRRTPCAASDAAACSDATRGLKPEGSSPLQWQGMNITKLPELHEPLAVRGGSANARRRGANEESRTCRLMLKSPLCHRRRSSLPPPPSACARPENGAGWACGAWHHRSVGLLDRIAGKSSGASAVRAALLDRSSLRPFQRFVLTAAGGLNRPSFA
jgi:hypothetical protein